MNEYTGKTCPFCRTPFLNSDEIVICSDCDMPHHKSCWVENQGCTTFGCRGTIQTADVAATSVTARQLVYEDNAVFCTQCGSRNGTADAFCARCGARLTTNAPVAGEPGAALRGDTAAEPAAEDVELDIVRLIGTNAQYYVPRFRTMKQRGKKTGWNWAAFLLAPFWLIYRKMYAYGAGLLAVSLAAALPGAAIVSLLTGVGCVLVGILGNRLYLRSLEEKAARLRHLPEPQRFDLFARHAGANTPAAVLTAVGCGMLALVIGA